MKIKQYVECIAKPTKDECGGVDDVTVGRIYPVTWIDESDYQIFDNAGNSRYYRHRFFKDAEWQEGISNHVEEQPKERVYEIDFGSNLLCKIRVSADTINVEAAINGWGDGIPLSEITIKTMHDPLDKD